MDEEFDPILTELEQRFFLGPRAVRVRSRESSRASVDDSTVLPVPFNPLLCKACQYWNDLALLASPNSNIRESLLINDALPKIYFHARAKNPDCLICNAVFVAAKNFVNNDMNDDVASNPDIWEHGVSIGDVAVACSDGLVFADDEHTRGYRIDYSRSAESRLRAFIRIKIISIELASEGDPVAVATFIPQFSLRYTKTMHTRLLGVESWEDAFFDIDLLGSWIQESETTCPDPSQSRTNIGTSEYFRNLWATELLPSP